MRKKLLFAVVALFTAVLLSSCALWPFGRRDQIFDDDGQQVKARMELIDAAVNSQDAAELKEMFSPRALEQATEFDEGLDYFLSYFPDGGLTWELIGVATQGENSYGKKTELLRVNYKVTADGEDYWVFFADFTANETIDPENVGLYALGVTPWTEEFDSGPAEQFSIWASDIEWDKVGENGYPGIYVPQEE